jgi:hypothetical protein
LLPGENIRQAQDDVTVVRSVSQHLAILALSGWPVTLPSRDPGVPSQGFPVIRRFGEALIDDGDGGRQILFLESTADDDNPLLREAGWCEEAESQQDCTNELHRLHF